MKITPLDIQQMEFQVRLRGYDRREVDQFLEELAQSVEMLIRENTSLRDRLAATEQQLAELKKAEATLTQTLMSSQVLADEMKQAAQREAELTLKEAELKAAEMLRDARTEVAVVQRDLSDVQKQRLLAIERLRATLRTFERLLEIEEGDQEPSPSAARVERLADN